MSAEKLAIVLERALDQDKSYDMKFSQAEIYLLVDALRVKVLADRGELKLIERPPAKEELPGPAEGPVAPEPGERRAAVDGMQRGKDSMPAGEENA